MRRAVRIWVALLALAGAVGCSKAEDDGDEPGGAAGVAAGSAGAAGVGTSGAGAGTAGTPSSGQGGMGTAGTPSSGQGGAGAAGVGTAGAGAGDGAAGMTASGAGGEGGGSGGISFATTCGAPMQNASVGNPCPGTPPPAIKLTLIAEGLVGPTFVAQAPGDPTRLYVTEQRGTLRVIKDGVLSPDFVIDLRGAPSGAVNADEIIAGYGEGGLLGMVFDPKFETNKRMWLSYTTPGPGFVVATFTMDNPDTLDIGTRQELVSYPMYGFFPGGDATNHVGSMLAFGPDGCLYISRGDGGGEMDRQMSGQDTSDDLCSILRIDPDNPGTPPPGNHTGLVWNYGFRNPWRFSFDRGTGDMYIGDVGQNVNTGFEEIEIEPRGVAGRNYGWVAMQGKSFCSGNCDGMTGPAVEYGITQTENSVIGGYVYRGSAIAGMQGRYIWADWTAREIKTLVYEGEPGGVPTVCDEHGTGVTVDLKVRSFGEDLAGEIYVLAGGAPTPGLTSAGVNDPGKLYRIDPM